MPTVIGEGGAMPPKVSVIIPMYNVAPYLAETLASTYDQSYQDFETLLIDDGSTDNTLALAQSFEPRPRIFTQSNKGPAAARNLGFQNARGRYLAWLDSDDLWHPEFLETMVNYLDSHPHIGLVYAESRAFIQHESHRVVVDKIGYTISPNLKLLLHGDCIPTSTIVFRRSCYEQIGGLDESLARAEDYEYLMRLAYSYQLAGIERPLAFYRLRADSLVGDNRDIDRGLQDAMLAIKAVEKLHPDIWERTKTNQAQLLARLQIRAAHAWKRRGRWAKAIRNSLVAFQYSCHLLVVRWLLAAALLKRWS
jgi:glycosyltransferase involved in cell wall biosynthesis